MTGVIVAIAGGSALGVLIGKIFDLIMYKQERKDQKQDSTSDEIKVIKQALMNLMLDRIRYVGQAHIKQGRISFDDRRILNSMHDSYKSLDGNGDLDNLMHEVDSLPLDV